MFSLHSTVLLLSLVYPSVLVYGSPVSSGTSDCRPFHYDFTTATSLGSSFVPATTDSKFDVNSNGLELFLTRPAGPVKTSGGINDILGQGATINSTFTLL
jgi:hypothetical protein